MLEPRKLALIPKEKLTEREHYLYNVYTEARNCITGSMAKLAEALKIDKFEFYRLLDTDMEFSNAIKCGLSDSRAERVLELESALINLALGYETKESITVDDGNGGIITKTTIRQVPPNLAATHLLLERYKGVGWSISSEAKVEDGATPKEIDYKMLNKNQLKQLAMGKNSEGD